MFRLKSKFLINKVIDLKNIFIMAAALFEIIKYIYPLKTIAIPIIHLFP